MFRTRTQPHHSMHPQRGGTGTVSSMRRRFRLAAVAAVAVAGSLLCVGSAEADNWGAFAGSYKNYTWWNCSIRVGAVQDPGSDYYHYQSIGGGAVSCSGRHSAISATVREYESAYGNGYGAWERGSGNWTTFSNSYGWGSGWFGTGSDYRILEDYAGCGGQGFYWQTRIYVTIDGYGSGWLPSPWVSKSGGC
jgi:hypothetical protein